MLSISIAKVDDIETIFLIGQKSLPIYYNQKILYTFIHSVNHLVYLIKQFDTDTIYDNQNENKKSQNNLGMMIISTENNKIHILSIAVLPEYRQSGIATQMIKYLKENYPKKLISLYVQTSNIIALNFYFKHQFKIKKHLEKYYPNLNIKSAFYIEYNY